MASIKIFDVSQAAKDLRLRISSNELTVSRLSRAFQAPDPNVDPNEIIVSNKLLGLLGLGSGLRFGSGFILYA